MLKVLLALFFMFILVAPGLTWWVAQRPVPVLDGLGEINGMQKPVLVRYDSRAIPYVKADTDEDAYAAQGYVVARERMFQMDMLRRAAEGRIAQVYGITALPTDRLMRTIGFERLAESELKYLSPQAKLAVDAYSRGVNAFIDGNGDKLGLEFTVLSYKPEPWRAVDTLAIMKYLAYELDESWKLDELRWRVTNIVGDNMAARLFNDNLAVSAWTPEMKANLAAMATANGKAAGNSVAGDANGAKITNGAKGTAHSSKTTDIRRNSGSGNTAPRPWTRRSSSTLAAPTSSSTSPSSVPPSPAIPPMTTPPSTVAPPNPVTPAGPGAFLNREAMTPIALGESETPAALGESETPAALRESKTPVALINEDFSRKFASLSRDSEFFRKPERSWGSTAWVLAPSFSKSGGAMLAADKHSALSTPCEYFLCSLTSNNLHVAGAAMPGVPGIMFGRNQLTSWSGSSMHADVQDLFVEHFGSEVDNKYKALTKVETAQETREAIPVRFGKDVDHKITTTKHGPILLRDKDSAIALSWTGFETKKPWLNTVCAMNSATDWDSFSQALSTYGGPPQLFVFADKKGNVGCHAAGILPIRAAGGQGTTMSEGWSSKGEWISSVEFNDLPQSFMPAGTVGRASGDFCVAAGQKLFEAPGSTGGFPQLWGHQWDAPYKANRLALSLPKDKNSQKLDLFDFNAYQGDDLNMMANLVVSELKKSMDANKSIDATQVNAMNLMQHWDFTMKHDSAAASCYESFVGALGRRLIEPKLNSRELANDYFQNWPLWTTFVEDYLRHKPVDMLPPGERTHDTFMLTTLDKSNTRLKLLFKNDKVDSWKWEQAHIANFKSVGLQGLSWLRSLLDINGIGVGGDSNCLDTCDVDRTSVEGRFGCNNGPSVRLLIDMSDDEAFYGNLALGQSGHYFSPYRQDQLKSWLRTDPLPIAFSEAQVDKQSRQKFYLSAPGYR